VLELTCWPRLLSRSLIALLLRLRDLALHLIGAGPFFVTRPVQLANLAAPYIVIVRMQAGFQVGGLADAGGLSASQFHGWAVCLWNLEHPRLARPGTELKRQTSVYV
jgi:hypothetical protein